jgi:hypothetical protein
MVKKGDIEALGVFNGFDTDMDNAIQNPYAHRLALYTTYGWFARPRVVVQILAAY